MDNRSDRTMSVQWKRMTMNSPLTNGARFPNPAKFRCLLLARINHRRLKIRDSPVGPTFFPKGGKKKKPDPALLWKLKIRFDQLHLIIQCRRRPLNAAIFSAALGPPGGSP